MSETTPADIAAVMGNGNDGWGNNSGIWAIVLIVIAAMFGGWGNRGGVASDAVTESGLCNAMNFSDLQNAVGRMSDEQAAIARQTDNAFSSLGYAMQSGFNDVGTKLSAMQADYTSQIQGVKDLIQQNKIDALQSQVQQLQLQQAMQGVVRYPDGYTYTAGSNPFCSCGSCGTNF